MLFAGSAICLTVIHPPFYFSHLAWIAFVPFILACRTDIKKRKLAIAAYIVGAFYWLGNLYWVIPVTIWGWIAYCLYSAFLWPAMALSFQYARRRGLPIAFAAAVIFVAAERLQGFFLGGFFWKFLAHSQFQNIPLIQIADIFGTAGLSFIIAYANGAIATLMINAINRNLKSPRAWLSPAVAILLIAATLLYGHHRLRQTQKFVTQGPMTAAVQSNVPQSVKETRDQSEEMFDQMLSESEKAILAGAELVVWPETMVQAYLNPAVISLIGDQHQYSQFDKRLKEHAKDNAYLLIGATAATPKVENDFTITLTEKFNSAFLYTPQGKQWHKRYDKIHLVPFGEVVPFKKSAPWLYNLLMIFTPYDHDYSLDYGSELTVFQMPLNGRAYNFGVLICYEDTVPKLTRHYVVDKNGNKRVDWLVNISNDGWFVWFKGDKIIPTAELPQHTALCVFRAVENRVAILRSVNTGISCLIDSSGKIIDGCAAGSLPQIALKRQGMAGWIVDKMPIDSRVTFFSRFGQWLDTCCTILFILTLIEALFGLFAKFLLKRGC